MRRDVRWERLFPDELEAAFAACPVVYFPYGLCEPHGPHCALGLDALKAHGIACAAAQAHGGIVAPVDYWHCHEVGIYGSWSMKNVGEVRRSWLTSLPPWQHFRNVCYHVRMADTLGFHAAIFLTGHYGPNWQDLKTVLRLLQPHVGTRVCGLPDWEANTPGFDGDGKSGGDHAGKVETSLLWALEPACVDLSRVPPPDAPGTHLAMGATCRQSNRLTGERMVQDEVRWLGAKAAELLDDYRREQPQHRLLTFEQVERLWEQTIRPAVHDFASMQPLAPGQEPVPESSVWHANWQIPERA
jgi:creatinine amidohydrolase